MHCEIMKSTMLFCKQNHPEWYSQIKQCCITAGCRVMQMHPKVIWSLCSQSVMMMPETQITLFYNLSWASKAFYSIKLINCQWKAITEQHGVIFAEYLSPAESCPLLYCTFVLPDTFDSSIYHSLSKNFQVEGCLFLRTTSYSVFQVFSLTCNVHNNLFFMKSYRLCFLCTIMLTNYISTVVHFLLIWKSKWNLLGFWKYYMDIVLYEYPDATEYHRTDW